MTQLEERALQICRLFEGLSEQERQRILRCLGAEKTLLRKGEIIWHMGDRVERCAVVLSGSVRAESVSASGTRSLVAWHQPGALVGDVLMVTPGSRSPVYVLAAEPATVLFIPYRGIMGGCPECCGAHARLRENLMGEIAQKYWEQRRRVRYLSEGSLRRRIAMYLRDSSGGARTFSLGGTREDLAAFLCVNRSALCRELGRMKWEGLIDFYRDTFRILQQEKLDKLT